MSDLYVSAKPGNRVRVAGKPGVWVVVRDTNGSLVIVKRGNHQTSVPREHLREVRGRR